MATGSLIDEVVTAIDAFFLQTFADARPSFASTALVRQRARSILETDGVAEALDLLAGNLARIIDDRIADVHPLARGIATINDRVARFLDEQGQDVVDAMRQVARAAGGPGDVDEVSRAVDTAMGRAATSIESAVRRTQEQALVEASEIVSEDTGIDWFYVYVGPADGKVRDYCRVRLGKALTTRAARALEPGERYNCRHDVAPITRAELERSGLTIFDEVR